MNKYLSVVATSELDNTLQLVISLQDDPVYDYIVPNLVRALIGSFARNYLFFHARDGSGYRFISEKIIATMNVINVRRKITFVFFIIFSPSF